MIGTSLATTVVTAADARFARTLWQMLRSAERRDLPRRHAFVAFDLGLTERQAVLLQGRFPWCRFRAFPFGGCPPHVSRLGTYAFKPIAFDLVVQERAAPVLWLDSATLFHDSLDPVFDRIAAHGVFSLCGQSSLARMTDRRTLAWLGVPVEDYGKPYRFGGAFGADGSRPVPRALAAHWRESALVEACIAPPERDAPVHRYDQSVLTALLYRFEREHGLRLLDDDVDISAAEPVRFISTRNKVPPWMPRAADPLVRAWHAAYKHADRAVIRLRRATA